MIVQQLVNGLTLGVMYSLLALGYSLIFGALSFINFAHGEVSMFGGFVGWYCYMVLGLNFIIACALGIIAAALIGMLMEFVGYRPIRNAPKNAMIAASVGFSYIVRTTVQLVFGTEPREFALKNVRAFNIIGDVNISSINLLVLLVSLVLMVGLQIFIHKTKPGRAIRAISLDMDTARMMGVNVDTTVSLTFAIGSGLGALSVIMLCLYYSQIYPTMGLSISGKAFAAVVLGGAGSIPGAMIGGVLLGIIENAAGVILSTQLREGVAFIVMILILIFRPAGLFGKEVTKD